MYSTQDIKKYGDVYKVKLCDKSKAKAGDCDGLPCKDKYCKDAHRDKTYFYVAKKSQPLEKGQRFAKYKDL